jgi:maltose alpha-D-glucosyltransferase/alpha-amylase
MQWSGGPGAGFSTAPAGKLYTAPISDPVYGYAAVNVEAQLHDPSSLLRWMQNLIRLRKQFKVLGRGTLDLVGTDNRKVFAYLRRWGEDAILCVANLSRHTQPAALDLSALEGARPVEMLGYTEFPRVGREPWFLSLNGYGFAWFELQDGGRSHPA